MNASRLKNMTAFPATERPATLKLVALRLPIVGLAALGLTACAGSFVAETDAQSPLAPRVQQIVEANSAYPRWSNFPATPTDLPQPAELAARVDRLDVSGAALGAEAARLEWLLTDPADFVAQVSRRTQAVPVSPASAQTPAQMDALAESLRQRATAPPPVRRRPLPTQ